MASSVEVKKLNVDSKSINQHSAERSCGGNLRKALLIAVFVVSILASGILGFFIGVNYKGLPLLLLPPLPGDEFYLTMGSGSMQPAINAGDTIRVKRVTNGSLIEVGDIIVFKRPSSNDEQICHRVTSKELHDGLWHFRTKGDANNTEDTWVGDDTWNGMISEKLLVGRVIS
jgi:signal peptidase I